MTYTAFETGNTRDERVTSTHGQDTLEDPQRRLKELNAENNEAKDEKGQAKSERHTYFHIEVSSFPPTFQNSSRSSLCMNLSTLTKNDILSLDDLYSQLGGNTKNYLKEWELSQK